MKKESKKDSGVSPVIGTILLVAITVVLVAIISAVVMGMTNDVGQTHPIGLQVSSSASTINIVWTGGDLDKISKISATGKDATFPDPATVSPTVGGSSSIIATTCTGNPNQYNIIANIDGKDEIIWTGTLKLDAKP